MEAYRNSDANHIVHIKNLLEYDSAYKDTTHNSFYFLDKNANTEADPGEVTFNKGFWTRKKLIGASVQFVCEIPLNKYSFFEALEYKMLPNTKLKVMPILFGKEQTTVEWSL